MKKISFLNYLFLMVVITVIFGVTYATVQQSHRTAADDPQIQIACDMRTTLQQGKPVEREPDFVTTVFFGWIICIGVVLLHSVLQFHYNR